MDIRIRKCYLSVLVTAVFVLAYSIGMAEDNVVLDELLTEVQKTLIRVNNSIEKDQLPPLNKITLKLKSTLVTKADGKVSLYIVQLGSTVTNETVQEIHLELKPPKTSDAALVQSIEDSLATAIIEAAKSAHKASQRKPPLRLSKLTAVVRFVVRTQGGGGVSFKLLPVTVKLGGEVRDVSTQQIIIEFKS
ncbi:MAG: hypothetical protein JRF36_03630 [Deltaproteobacteria bacterium]|nr:hypothetical protein [Deltaproteobacteria bacterium]